MIAEIGSLRERRCMWQPFRPGSFGQDHLHNGLSAAFPLIDCRGRLGPMQHYTDNICHALRAVPLLHFSAWPQHENGGLQSGLKRCGELLAIVVPLTDFKVDQGCCSQTDVACIRLYVSIICLFSRNK